MLPFLKSRKSSGTVMATADAQGATKDMPDMHPELMKHADNMIGAMRTGDAQRLAQSLKAVHEHFNAEEDESEEPEASGDSQS